MNLSGLRVKRISLIVSNRIGRIIAFLEQIEPRRIDFL